MEFPMSVTGAFSRFAIVTLVPMAAIFKACSFIIEEKPVEPPAKQLDEQNITVPGIDETTKLKLIAVNYNKVGSIAIDVVGLGNCIKAAKTFANLSGADQHRPVTAACTAPEGGDALMNFSCYSNSTSQVLSCYDLKIK
jgi:hypothetical protein